MPLIDWLIDRKDDVRGQSSFAWVWMTNQLASKDLGWGREKFGWMDR